MKKNKSMIKTMMLLVSLASIFTACSPAASPAASPADNARRTAAGNWGTFKTLWDGYGDRLDLFFELEMNNNGQCVQRKTGVLSEKVYEELNCSYKVQDDGRIWITYDGGRTLQAGLEDSQLVIYDIFSAFSHDRNLKFEQME